MPVDLSLSLDGDSSIAAPPVIPPAVNPDHSSALLPATYETATSAHLNDCNTMGLSFPARVPLIAEDLRHRLTPAGFPCTNAHNRAMVWALTHRGWKPQMGQAQSSHSQPVEDLDSLMSPGCGHMAL